MNTKVCTRCKMGKSLNDFYKARRNRDGRKSWCKQCEINYSREYYQDGRGKEAKRHYDQSPKGRANQKRSDSSAKGKARHARYNTSEKGKAYFKKARENHPGRTKARDAINNAVKDGKMPHVKTLNCFNCGKQAEEYHHYKGYNERYYLDVQPVCIICHRIIDNDNLT